MNHWGGYDDWESPPRSPKGLRWVALALAGLAVYGLGVFTARIWNGPGTYLGIPEALNSTPNSETNAVPPDLNSNTITRIYRSARSSIVTITAVGPANNQSGPQEDIGTGFFVDTNGDIATNNHVVSGHHKVTVTFSDNRSVVGTVVGTDALDDLAVVRVDRSAQGPIPPLVLGSSRTLQPGDMVVAIGNPFELTESVTAGIVSGLNRSMQTDSGREMTGLLQTDAALNPGNSGGPLFNSSGQVVGINTAIESPVQGSVGIGFAIPIDRLEGLLPQLIKGERISHPWLGIVADDIIPSLQQTLHLPVGQGVLVLGVTKNGPAAKAGLHPDTAGPKADLPKGDGDIIIAVNGKSVSSVADLTAAISEYSVGTAVDLTVIRHGSRIHVRVVLGNWDQRSSTKP